MVDDQKEVLLAAGQRRQADIYSDKEERQRPNGGGLQRARQDSYASLRREVSERNGNDEQGIAQMLWGAVVS